MSLDLADDKSTLVQVMAWCRQATSHYLNQCWLRSLSPYGVTRPQWVKVTTTSPRGQWVNTDRFKVITYQVVSSLFVMVSLILASYLCNHHRGDLQQKNPNKINKWSQLQCGAVTSIILSKELAKDMVTKETNFNETFENVIWKKSAISFRLQFVNKERNPHWNETLGEASPYLSFEIPSAKSQPFLFWYQCDIIHSPVSTPTHHRQ